MKNMKEYSISVTVMYGICFWLFLEATFLFSAGSELYPWPTDWSPGKLASWSQPLIASGTALPPVASASIGDLFFIHNDEWGTAPLNFDSVLYIRRDIHTAWNGNPIISTWTVLTGGSGGTTDHSGLTNLAFDDAAHTGFAREAGSETADFKTKDLDVYGNASVSGTITENGSLLSALYAALNGSSTANFNADMLYGNGLTLGDFILSYISDPDYQFACVTTSTNSKAKFSLGFPATGVSRFFASSWSNGLTLASDGINLASGSFGFSPAQNFGIYRNYIPGSYSFQHILLFEVTASGAISLKPLSAAPSSGFEATGSIYFDSASNTLKINDGSNWVGIPKQGGEITGAFLASDTTLGKTEDVLIPFEYNVSTITLHFKDGLYVGKTLP